MSEVTPQRMRELADEAESETCRLRYTAKESKSLALEQAAALRAAADQLEAVQALANLYERFGWDRTASSIRQFVGYGAFKGVSQ